MGDVSVILIDGRPLVIDDGHAPSIPACVCRSDVCRLCHEAHIGKRPAVLSAPFAEMDDEGGCSQKLDDPRLKRLVSLSPHCRRTDANVAFRWQSAG